MFHPYKNESESLGIGELTVENRTDRIELYGSLQLTRDKAGLALALSLKELLDATVKALQAESLPEKIEGKPEKKVSNPFK
ncbi:MAG: hypothetical protein A3J24_03615 [Deltaproteobacteria bacterium RIFCSPLOWO2_02_FULL_53_8]|nr:MAG: hypothetical protein A3J24_03615 [Deltaproteobacteria bacterium RIFCSPLOWO2_02_FULL_53_8]